MREIKFRGKCPNGEWIYGYYYQKQNPHSEDGLPIKHYISDLPPFGAEVDPATVGQFTGLKDKNGREIWEGDIVKYGNTIHKVVFEQRNNTAYFGLVYSPAETLPFGHYQDLRQIEVIGDIHDNPELIEGKGGIAWAMPAE